jgi:NAD(P)H-hydrate epimerase
LQKYQIVIVLKGAYTQIITPEKKVYFNSTGNPGMATAGSGDVLTGMILSLLGQHYSPVEAAILGVYIHGLAGDQALKFGESEESLTATSIVRHLGDAYQALAAN